MCIHVCVRVCLYKNYLYQGVGTLAVCPFTTAGGTTSATGSSSKTSQRFPDTCGKKGGKKKGELYETLSTYEKGGTV
jgi:hypothetical protein